MSEFESKIKAQAMQAHSMRNDAHEQYPQRGGQLAQGAVLGSGPRDVSEIEMQMNALHQSRDMLRSRVTALHERLQRGGILRALAPTPTASPNSWPETQTVLGTTLKEFVIAHAEIADEIRLITEALGV